MSDVDTLRENLKRLRKDLPKCCEVSSQHFDDATNAARDMPLSHSTSEMAFLGILESGKLLSTKALGKPPRYADQELGRVNDVCLYLGSTTFPSQEIGLLFSAELTNVCPPDTVATPFDSGGCVSKYPLPEGLDRIEFVRNHEMEVPECRGYLQDLLETHFRSVTDYLSGAYFCCPVCGIKLDDPHSFKDAEPTLLIRQHEVRIPDKVNIAQPHLRAIFLPKSFNDPSAATKLASLLGDGVEIRRFQGRGTRRTYALRDACTAYIRSEIFN